MKILFVLNNFYTKGNGLVASAQRTVKKLIEAGEEVKVLSAPNKDRNGPQPDFVLEDLHYPLIDGLVQKQGYSFSNADKDVINKAVEWADVVHLDEPFPVQAATAKIAKKLHKPITGTYHLHPENMLASVGLGKEILINWFFFTLWKKTVFDKCDIVQCPTQNVYERLKRHHLRPELRVISNGLVLEDLMRKENVTDVEKISDAKYNIITIGRYSSEKNLKTLLKAMKYSKYSQDIQLIIAGQGPKEKSLRKRADKMLKKGYIKYPPKFGFYKLEELQKFSSTADLYVHCAYIEVEGLSCMEAIQIGLVPIIAKGKYTATSQFALSDKSIYQQRDPKDLANKIDYWFDHDEDRLKEAKKYIGIGEKYNIDYSITQLRKMFLDAYNKHHKAK